MTAVTDALRNDILAGRYEPGDRLTELELTDAYGCGRATIRSALVTLASEGLVQHEANRGATVRRISIDEAIQITEARSALECLIAAHAARHTTEADHDELRDAIAQMEAAVADDRAADYSRLNAHFHQRLCELSRHDVAAGLISNLRNRSIHHRYRLSVMPGRARDSLQQHAAIVDAIVAGDEDAASAAMRDHLQSVIAVLGQWGDLERS